MYQIFKFQDRRKRQLNVLTKKPASRWDDGEIPAQWSSRQAAHKWAKSHLDLMPFGYIILEDAPMSRWMVDGAHISPAEGNPYFLCLDCLKLQLSCNLASVIYEMQLDNRARDRCARCKQLVGSEWRV